jgi:hypothetical protein
VIVPWPYLAVIILVVITAFVVSLRWVHSTAYWQGHGIGFASGLAKGREEERERLKELTGRFIEVLKRGIDCK